MPDDAQLFKVGEDDFVLCLKGIQGAKPYKLQVYMTPSIEHQSLNRNTPTPPLAHTLTA